jgi:YggT family protein
MCALYQVVDIILSLYWWCIIVYVIMSWLVAFNIVNTYNPVVNAVGGFLHKIIEPLMKQIRRVLPVMGGLDLAPLVVLLGLFFIRQLMLDNWGRQACLGVVG